MAKRITSDTNYKKNNKSVQESLSPDEIKHLLDEYKHVDNIEEVPINTHIRYFSKDPKTGKKLFRLGGNLIKNEAEYIVLSNGKLSWSVQKNTSDFFQKMSFKDLKEEILKKITKKYEKQINELIEENTKLKETIKDIKNTVRKNK